MNLICANAIRYEKEPMKPIICKVSGMLCTAVTCADPDIGFVVNSWIRRCPAFIDLHFQPPYITKIVKEKVYNPNYGDNRICECGHSYDRHFDSYEDMEPCGCKYCSCHEFVEKEEG